MNQVYRVIFNHAMGVYQCVCEFAKSSGKSKSLKTLSVSVALVLSGQALAENKQYTGVTQNLSSPYTADGDVVSGGSKITARVVNVKNGKWEIVENSNINSSIINANDGSRTNVNGSSIVADVLNLSGNAQVSFDNKSRFSKVGATVRIGAGSKDASKTASIHVKNGSQLASGEVFVGLNSKGKLTIDGGSQVVANDHFNVGNLAEGTAIVSGETTSLVAKGERATRIGDGARGTLIIQEGARADLRNVYVGVTTASPDVRGVVEITGNNSLLLVDDLLEIGSFAHGELKAQQGGRVTTNNLTVASMAGSQGEVLIGGKNTHLHVKNNAVIGAEGQGSLVVNEQAQAIFDKGLGLGSDAGGVGTVTVTGNNLETGNANLYVKGGLLNIGIANQGVLNINHGATVAADADVIAGKFNQATGTINLDRGILSVTGRVGDGYGDLVLGEAGGQGVLNARNQSSIATKKNFVLGQHQDSTGKATIDDSHVAVAQNLIVGQEGVGELTIHNKGAFDVGHTAYLGFKDNHKNNKITVDTNGTLRAEKLIFNGVGQNELLIKNGGSLAISESIEAANNKKANVIFDGGVVIGSHGTTKIDLFKNFTDAHKIEIKDKGVSFSIAENQVATIADTARITGVGRLEKTGKGELRLSANTKNWQGGTDIQQGTVRIDGDYTFKDNEVLQIGINSQTNYGKLNVNGKADISKGVLSIKAADVIAQLKGGTWQDIVTAKQLIGKFKSVQNINPLVTFDISYDGNNIHLSAKPPITQVPKDAPTVPDKPKGVPPAVIEPAPKPQPKPETKVPPNAPMVPEKPQGKPPITQVPKDAPTVPDKPKGVPPAVIEPAPKPQPKPETKVPPNAPMVPEKPKVTPAFTDAANQENVHHLLNLAHQLDNAYLDFLQNKNSNNALGKALIADSDGLKGDTDKKTRQNLNQINRQLQPLLMGAVNEALIHTQQKITDITKEQLKQQKNVWVTALESQTDKNNLTGGITGYHQKDKGLVIGAAKNSDNAHVGLALSYVDSGISANQVNHHAKAKTVGAHLYAAQNIGNTQAYGQLGVAQANIDGERHIDILKAGVAKSDHQATLVGGSFGVSHRFGTTAHHVAPFVDVGYVQSNAKGYQETGTKNYNLTVGKAKTDSFYGEVGIKWQYGVGSKLSVAGALSGLYDNGDKYNVTSAHFSQTPSARFTTLTPKASRHAGKAQLGVHYQMTPSAKFTLDYQGQWRRDLDSQGVKLGASIVF